MSGVKLRHHIVRFGEFGPTVGDINPGGSLLWRGRNVSLLAREGRAHPTFGGLNFRVVRHVTLPQMGLFTRRPNQ